MSERDDFLSAVIPQQIAAERALHNGDAEPRRAIYSRNDPVTIFGAGANVSGWDDVDRAFVWLESVFSECESYEFDVVVADVIGDLAYTGGYEHVTASVNGVRQTFSLRVTHLYRREGGEWKIVHRHANPASPVEVPTAPDDLSAAS